MLKKIKVSVVTLMLTAAPLFSVIPVAQADDINATCTEWQRQQGLCEAGLRPFILTILNWFLLFLGLIATGFLIFGGFQYLTSAGNDQNIEKAKKTIIYAAVGILVILLASVLVNALLGIPTDANP